MKTLLLIIASSSFILILSLHVFASPQETSVQPSVTIEEDASQLTIDRIFAGKDFQEERFGQITCCQASSNFFTFKPSKATIGGAKGRDLVRVDCESGTETVIASSEMHWMMAERGYIVASVDNRGTMSPRGRAWRKCVYRQIGILASQDQAAAANVLLDRWPFVDRTRVGIWGWSGGGSMSLNAIFRYPDLYQTAVAVAPVPNQLLYDTIYQERYMGLPDDNAAGYRDGSPITFAKQLKGNLLLVHGTGDDNCHYQGVELLMNELITHNKPFSAMPYPGRSHAISEGANTTRHFYALLARYLDEHVHAKRTETKTE